MKRPKPRTRTAAAAPRDTAHLSVGQQSALEIGHEAEHATGRRKEKLIRRATRLATRSSGH
jgi:hypothetical protein